LATAVSGAMLGPLRIALYSREEVRTAFNTEQQAES
jgi:hypothetical protein